LVIQDFYIQGAVGEEFFCKGLCISRGFEICYVVSCPGEVYRIYAQAVADS